MQAPGQIDASPGQAIFPLLSLVEATLTPRQLPLMDGLGGPSPPLVPTLGGAWQEQPANLQGWFSLGVNAPRLELLTLYRHLCTHTCVCTHVHTHTLLCSGSQLVKLETQQAQLPGTCLNSQRQTLSFSLTLCEST